MTVPHEERERSLAFAEIALGQIRALGQAASPRNFEIWYHYASGYNQALNQSINETLKKKGALNEADLAQIYDTYISDSRMGERFDSVGTRVLDEVKQVLDMVNAAAGSATSYSESLADASEKLAGANDGDTRGGRVAHEDVWVREDGRGPTRTGDPLGVSEVLWPTELRALLARLRLAARARLPGSHGRHEPVRARAMLARCGGPA